MQIIKSLRKYDLALLVLSVAVFAVLEVLIDLRIISSFWRLQIILIGINIILAASLNLINGITGQFSLGHAGFMAVGAYVSAVMSMWYDLPFGMALLIGGLAACFIGVLIGIPTLRLDGDYLAIATLGMGEIIRICILNIQAVGGASGLTGIPRSTTFAWVFWIMIITLFFLKNMINSTYGRSCISVRENAIAAAAMGINTTFAKVLAFAVGAFFAGLAGGLFSHYFSIAHPSSFTFLNSYNYLTMVVLGGLGSMTGSITGAALITFITAALADYPEVRMIIYALCLILLMLFRPQGLFGSQEGSLLLRRLMNRRKEAAANGKALETSDLSKSFGGIKAVQNFLIHIDEGEVIGLIGPNGAGKTTAFNLLTGVYTPTTGKILFDGRDITGRRPYQITAQGIARTFQNIRLFGELSVLENVKIAFTLHASYSFPEAIFRIGRYGREEQIIDERARELLAAFKLDGLAGEQAKNLPYGQQRRLEIARALATRPKLLLLDEPAAGMNPQETRELTEMIRWIRDTYRLSILLIEHDMALVMKICERIYVLDYGKILAEGTPGEIRSNPAVIKAYLGTEG